MPQRSKHHLFYRLMPSVIGEMGILWREKGESLTVAHILLPDRTKAMADLIPCLYPDAVYTSTAVLDRFCRQLQDFLSGVPVISGQTIWMSPGY